VKHRPSPQDRKFVDPALALSQNTLPNLHKEVDSIGGSIGGLISSAAVEALLPPSAASVAAEAAACAASQAVTERRTPFQRAHGARMPLVRTGSQAAWAEAVEAWAVASQAWKQAVCDASAAQAAFQEASLSGPPASAAQAAYQEQRVLFRTSEAQRWLQDHVSPAVHSERDPVLRRAGFCVDCWQGKLPADVDVI
jgi:hypothetical protein